MSEGGRERTEVSTSTSSYSSPSSPAALLDACRAPNARAAAPRWVARGAPAPQLALALPLPPAARGARRETALRYAKARAATGGLAVPQPVGLGTARGLRPRPARTRGTPRTSMACAQSACAAQLSLVPAAGGLNSVAPPTDVSQLPQHAADDSAAGRPPQAAGRGSTGGSPPLSLTCRRASQAWAERSRREHGWASPAL